MREREREREMYLKKALWAEGVAAKESPESELQQEPAATAVQELVKSLTRQRLYREVTLALKTGLRDARAEFSFLRVRGLRSLLKFLRSVAESDSTIQLFCQTQSLLELQGSFFRSFLSDLESSASESKFLCNSKTKKSDAFINFLLVTKLGALNFNPVGSTNYTRLLKCDSASCLRSDLNC